MGVQTLDEARTVMSRPVLAAGVLIAVMSLLRAYAGFHYPLTADEAYYWSWSQHLWMGYTDHPPMVAWLIALGNQFGHAYGFVRLPFVASEALAAIAVGMATAVLANDTRAGAFAAIVFTLVPQTKLEFAESIPDGAYMCAWALALWAAAALARRASWRAAAALALALAATVYSRTFGWALVFGVVAWAVTARRDLLRYVAFALAFTLVAYVPFLLWNASVGWENFTFTFVHRQSIAGFSLAKAIDISTLRFMLYGGLIVALTWFVALRRPPMLTLVAWTALPLPLALFVLSFAMRTESYWIIGPAASLSIAVGIALARAGALARGLTFGVLAASTAYATFAALFLAQPEAAQAAFFDAHPSWRSALASGAYVYEPLAAELRAQAAADGGAAIFTDGYETSAELLWYGVPSHIVVPSLQLPEWTRWYGSPSPPQHALLVMLGRPLADEPGLSASVHSAYAHVTPGAVLPYAFAGQPEGTFYVTRLDDPLPGARAALPGM
jgi:4-amino-4-deoxy-L-arabinose transferase-like glycosyltransferase